MADHRPFHTIALLVLLASVGTAYAVAAGVYSENPTRDDAGEIENLFKTALEAMVAADKDGADLRAQAAQFNSALKLASDAKTLAESGDYTQASMKLEQARQVLESLPQDAEVQRQNAIAGNMKRTALVYASAIIFITIATIIFALALRRYRRFAVERTLEMEIGLK